MSERLERPFLEFRDPAEMAAIYSNENAITPKHLIIPQFAHDYNEVRRALRSLPKKEQDFIYLYFVVRMTQEHIAAIFELSQGDVSYRINRILKRLRFVFDLPSVDLSKMQADLASVLSQEQIRILMCMARSTSQTVTGLRLGLTQGRVRYRFLKALSVIENCKKDNSDFNTYLDFFRKISGNFNILRALASRDYFDKFYLEKLDSV